MTDYYSDMNRRLAQRVLEQQGEINRLKKLLAGRCNDSFVDVVQAIGRERRYQDRKWGTIQENPHTVGEWLLILSAELGEALSAWTEEIGDTAALDEIRQVAAVAVACLEQHGVVEREGVQS